MDARRPRGCDDVVRIGAFGEARDVLRDLAREQLHVLWQVADMLTQRASRPLLKRGAVEADGSARWTPHADNRARKARLSAGARTDDAKRVALLQAKGDILHHRSLVARG